MTSSISTKQSAGASAQAGIDETPVLIVGGGPSGLMLAIELGCRGVPCVLLEAQLNPPVAPKANATSSRTMEHYRRRGFAQAVRKLGLTAQHPNDIVYCTRLGEHELARFRIPSRAAAASQTDFGDYTEAAWPTAELPHRAQQMLIEPVLREQLRHYPSVTTRFGWQAQRILRQGDAVEVLAQCVTSAEQAQWRARFVIGCDGPRSLVRKAMGVQYEGASQEQRDFFGGQMLTIHFRSADLYRAFGIGEQRRAAWMVWIINEEQRGLFFAINGVDEFALGIQLKPGQSVESVDVDAVFKAVSASDGREKSVPFSYTVLNRNAWTAGYTLVAERFREGPLFIAGDAAHLFTPTGGMGYNTSVDDAVNLAWKLAATVQGWGGEGLLDTYHQERHPIAQRNTRFARAMADSIGRIAIPSGLEDNCVSADEKRKQMGLALAAHVANEFNIPGLTLGLRYESDIIAREDTAPPPDSPNVYVPSSYPGARAPHVPLAAANSSLHDSFGRDFTLLCFASTAASHAWESEAARLGIPLTVLCLTQSDARTAYAASFVLIRPDHHVAWRGDDPAQVLDQLARAAGRKGTSNVS